MISLFAALNRQYQYEPDLYSWNFMMPPVDSFRTYLFSYWHRGAKWAFDIKATSPEDAKARLAKIAVASYDGELIASMSVPETLSRRLVGWWRKWLQW